MSQSPIEIKTQTLKRTISRRNITLAKKEVPSTGNQILRRISYINKICKPEDCVLCQRKIRRTQMPQIIHKALFRRYCSSVNYFYTREVNKIIENQRSAATLNLKEIHYEKLHEEDNIVQFVKMDCLPETFENLWKYHQFNIDQPKLRGKAPAGYLERYFCDKRKLQERAIRKMLNVLSDSELEKCELNLDAFMNDRIEILEHKLTKNRVLIGLPLLKPIKTGECNFSFRSDHLSISYSRIISRRISIARESYCNMNNILSDLQDELSHEPFPSFIRESHISIMSKSTSKQSSKMEGNPSKSRFKKKSRVMVIPSHGKKGNISKLKDKLIELRSKESSRSKVLKSPDRTLKYFPTTSNGTKIQTSSRAEEIPTMFGSSLKNLFTEIKQKSSRNLTPSQRSLQKSSSKRMSSLKSTSSRLKEGYRTQITADSSIKKHFVPSKYTRSFGEKKNKTSRVGLVKSAREDISKPKHRSAEQTSRVSKPRKKETRVTNALGNKRGCSFGNLLSVVKEAKAKEQPIRYKSPKSQNINQPDVCSSQALHSKICKNMKSRWKDSKESSTKVLNTNTASVKKKIGKYTTSTRLIKPQRTLKDEIFGSGLETLRYKSIRNHVAK